ncbi:MAG: extracellular solute-binding protein [Microthrixaceae bacterium]|nr:extracellular solute-binding protein [Microthrixaceae bacterium]
MIRRFLQRSSQPADGGSRYHGRSAVLMAIAATTLLLAGCFGDDGDGSMSSGSDLEDPGDCVAVDVAVSSEKIDLLKDLASTFNRQKNTVADGTCIFVRPVSKASGGAATRLAEGWDEDEDGPRPVIWSPAAASWGAVLNQKLADRGQPAMAPADAEPLMLTPLVIAMPEPMAEALGYPDTPIGWADLARLATDPEGWAAHGHPEWGAFRLGKTNPNFSTSGISALIAQTYAAAGKTGGLSTEDLNNPAVLEFSRQIESSVVHYGDITMTFLNNWFAADRRGTSLTYASAVAVEEKSVIDYNSGNPDGVLSAGETPREPNVKLVSIYPTEGTLYSDSPFYILDAEWVSDAERDGAEQFTEFVLQADNQRRVLDYGFRPANPAVALGAPIVADNGVDPAQPSTLLEVPAPSVMVDLLDLWAANRKQARVLIVLDVSGSMGDSVDGGDGDTKLELAKDAVIGALGDFNPGDEVGLRIFSTGLGPNEDLDFQDLQPIEAIAANAERLRSSIRSLVPVAGTPLYTVAKAAYDEMQQGYDPTKINAVILLTDGANEDGDDSDDRRQLNELVESLRASSTGELARPIRMFTVGYGQGAQTDVLNQIASASAGAAYNAKDASTISKVFEQVVSNF